MDIQSTIAFLKSIERFKTCYRACRTTDPARPESDAEHTWHLAVFLLLLEDALEGVDFGKILKIALIHDLPEIYAGDTNPYRGDTANKAEKEKAAAKTLFSGLPDHLQDKLEGLFAEYTDQHTAEAQLVKSADKLMPLIQNLCTHDTFSSYRDLEVQVQEVRAYLDPFFQENGILKSLYEALLEAATQNDVFYRLDFIPKGDDSQPADRARK